MDSGDKASNKAMSSAFKYAFIETFCVPTEEDKDTDVGSFSSQDKTARVQQQIASKPVPPLEPEIPYADTPFEDYGSPAPANDHPAGNYEFPSVAKKYVGKKLKDVPMKELKEYATYMRNFMSSDGRTIRGKWVALFDAIDAYLGVR